VKRLGDLAQTQACMGDNYIVRAQAQAEEERKFTDTVVNPASDEILTVLRNRNLTISQSERVIGAIQTRIYEMSRSALI
jgi:hypothetical protein